MSLLLVLALTLAGCTLDEPQAGEATPGTTTTTTPQGGDGGAPAGSYRAMGFDGETWPRLDGVTLTILDHGAFGAFEDAKRLFENLTGATVVHVEADDSGSALHRAAQEKGSPTFDVIYGVDNVLWARALEMDVFEPYTPLLADRVDPSFVFFDAEGAWPATPVDHGFVAVNWDPAHPALANATLDDLGDVRDHAGLFVTQDPRTSTPGLGFLLATIATYPEGTGDPLAGVSYTWRDYWTDLFEGGVLVTSGWTEAYEQRFSGGYGADFGGRADKPIVTSYTTSPAYEAHFGRDPAAIARVLTAPNATFHQVETMGIAKGTPNLAAAQAWIEFTLTDGFQRLVAPHMAVYPVVEGVPVNGTFGDLDPAPAALEPAALDHGTIGANVERWVREWVDLCEAHDCA